MPRKPRKRRQPFAFSPFVRSAVQIASAYKAKRRQIQDFQLQKMFSSGHGFSNHALKDKIEQAEYSEGEDSEGVVQADFAFFDPKPADFHGVKVLLQTYLDDKEWDLSGFVDLILAQTTVGTVVKLENDEDDGLYSVLTALNLGRYKDHKCMVEIKEFLLKVCQLKDVLDCLNSFMGEQAQHVGLLVSQRVVNLPPQLLPPLYDALFDEVSWATEDEPTEELRNSFRFKFYLLISRIYKNKNADQARGPRSSSDEAILYIKPEDEIFHKLKDYRLVGFVMAVEASKISTFRQQLKALIDE